MTEQLFKAITAGDADVVRQLVSADPALVHADNAGGVPAIVWARYTGRPELAELLGALATELTLAEASALGNTDRVRALVDQGADVDEATSDGFTPLHYAAFFGHHDLAVLLVDRGALLDAVAVNDMRVTPLHSAAAARHHDVAMLLVEAGADVRAVQTRGWTALHAAAEHGDAELVQALLSRGADATARADDGTTPIELADAGGFADLASLLRSKRAEQS